MAPLGILALPRLSPESGEAGVEAGEHPTLDLFAGGPPGSCDPGDHLDTALVLVQQALWTLTSFTQSLLSKRHFATKSKGGQSGELLKSGGHGGCLRVSTPGGGGGRVGELGTTGQQACLVASRVSKAEKAMSECTKGVTQRLAGRECSKCVGCHLRNCGGR